MMKLKPQPICTSKSGLPCVMYAACVVLALLAFGQIFAQSTKTFSDRFGEQGRVRYSGTWVDSILPANGPYALEWRDINLDTLRTLRASGRLRQHLPDGSWTWEEADWEYAISPGRNTLVPFFGTTGTQQLWWGQFDQGTATGPWVYVKGTPPLNPLETTAPLRIDAQLRQGRMVGRFAVSDKSGETPIDMVGYTDANGIAEKTWTIRYTDGDKRVVEKHQFERGVLIYSSVSVEGQTEVEIAFADRKAVLSRPAKEHGSVAIGQRMFALEPVHGRANVLVEEYLTQKFLKGWQHEAFPFEPMRRGPIFKRLEYHLTPEDRLRRDSIANMAAVLHEEIVLRFEGRNVEIKRARSSQLDLSIAALQSALRLTDAIDTLMKGTRHPLFTYHHRDGGALHHHFDTLSTLSQARGVVYPEADRVIGHFMPSGSAETYFERLLHGLKEVKDSVNVHFALVDQIFSDLRKENEIRELEFEMSQKLVLLDSLYDPLEGLGATIGEVWVDGYLNEALRDYAQIDDYTEAMARGAEMLVKMDSLIGWKPHWAELSKMPMHLEEGYKYYVYNPYTGVRDIELAVKTRFRRHVQEVLLPWMYREIETAGDWKELTRRLNEGLILKQELLRFALLEERADSRIERRIRNENNPDKMLRLFLIYMEYR